MKSWSMDSLKLKQRSDTMENRYETKRKLLRYSDYCSYAMIFFYLNAILLAFPLALYFGSDLIFWIILLSFGYCGVMCMALSFILAERAYNRN